MAFQKPNSRHPDRKDHIWFRTGEVWKCCLCGAVTASKPPDYPTPEDWMPLYYQGLTDKERQLCPFQQRG